MNTFKTLHADKILKTTTEVSKSYSILYSEYSQYNIFYSVAVKPTSTTLSEENVLYKSISTLYYGFNNHLVDLIDIVNLEKEIQFYSLRDSGIIEKIRDGLDLITVMQLADHSSLEMTNVYAKIANNGASKEAMRKITKFSNY